MTQQEIIKNRATELKEFVGLSLSYDDCEEFVITVLADAKQITD